MKTIDRKDLLNLWLNKYHNTSVDEVVKTHSKEWASTPEWFKEYPCTEEEHDKWVEEAKKFIRKETKISKAMLNRQWPLVYLDCSPYVSKK